MYEVKDNLFPAELLAEAEAEWPAESWSGWFRYDSRGQRGKLTCADPRIMPAACRKLLGLMALRGPAGTIPDLSLYGGGMHLMPAGTKLGRHLDADTHALYGLARVASMVLFVGPWQATWGGALVFPRTDGIGRAVLPAPGRLVTFSSEGTEHEVLRCDRPRKSLALFFYGGPCACKRPRAEFLEGG